MKTIKAVGLMMLFAVGVTGMTGCESLEKLTEDLLSGSNIKGSTTNGG